MAALAFQLAACLSRQERTWRLQANFVGSERFLGRDMLNC
jgi:hypothetical protein